MQNDQNPTEIKLNNFIAIGTEILNIKNFPNIIKEYITGGLKKNEKVIFFTDDILNRDIEEIFEENSVFIRENTVFGKFSIITYETVNFNIESEEFLNIIKIINSYKDNIRIVWDFKNISKRNRKVDTILDCLGVIKNCRKCNLSNIMYINNNYKYEELKKLSEFFSDLIIIDRGREMRFVNEEIDKALWILQSNSQLKDENKNLVLFNDIYSNMPKSKEKDEFKSIIINRLREACGLDFCIIYNQSMNRENIVSLDSYFGITKKHKYHMINNKVIIKYQNYYNNFIMESGDYYILNDTDIEEKKSCNVLKKMGIKTCVGFSVEYYESTKGVIWVGRYEDSKILDRESINYIESLCKTAFYIIQEHERFLELQNKLIENEKLRAMGEMAAYITHDINNILTPIIGSVQLLKDYNIENKDIIKQINTIQICAEDGITISNKIKKFTKSYSNSDELEIFNIDEVILDAVDLTKSKWIMESAVKGIKTTVIPILNSKANIKGSITEIREVFINMIRNAIDSMDKGGKIEIITRNEYGKVYIEIRDNGIGMNKEVIKRVFEPFFTTKGNNGSGLGLSICYNIINSHNGSISVESEENVGTVFKIQLPICNDSKAVIEKTDEDAILDFEANILVIDDQENIRNVITDMIKSISKCRVKSSNGDNIKNEIKRRNYDIVFCDFSMPNINGLEVAKIIKSISPNTYFCLMTGWIGNFTKDNIEIIDSVVNKPIDKSKIRQILLYNKNKLGDML